MLDRFNKMLIDKLFYHLDVNKKIKDFYCINDKAVTPSLNPKLEKDRRGKTWLCCKCEKCGNNKKIHITCTWNIYKDDEYEDNNVDDEDVNIIRRI